MEQQSPCCYFLYTVKSVLLQCCLNDQRSEVHCGFSGFSLCILWTVWSVDGEITVLFAVVSWEMLLFNCCFFTKWWTSPHPCLWMTEPFEDALFITHSRYCHPLPEPVYLWNVPNSCFVHIPQPSQSFVAPVPTCLKRVAVFGFKISLCLQKSKKVTR